MMNSWGMGEGTGSMMGVMGLAGLLLWLAIFIDLVLLGVWLWKLIQKN